MTSIDWSKAPRATHYLNSGDPHTRFRDCSSENWWFYNDRDDTWSEFHMPSADLVQRPDCIARPVWDDEGLPPVGTVCQVHRNGTEWAEVQIIAHFRNSAAMVAAFIPTAEGEKHVSQAIAECFRPIRTVEQIAADERNRGIDALCEFIRGTAGGNDFHRPFWERAYDRGLRAPE